MNITINHLVILQAIYKQDFDPSRRTLPKLSMKELAKEIRKSVGYTHQLVSELRDNEYMSSNSGRQARSMSITDEGIQALKEANLLPVIRKEPNGIRL